MQALILFFCDMFEPFVSSDKFLMYGCVMYQNESVGFEQVEKFVQEVVGVLSDQTELINVKEMNVSMKAWLWIDDIASFTIKLQYSIPSPLREVTAIQNQVERYQVVFIKPNGCNFDILADESVTHCGMKPSQIWSWHCTKVIIALAGLYLDTVIAKPCS